jgi:hypothetical protein
MEDRMHTQQNRKEGAMHMHELKMPPFNTTLMGVLRGVFDYYGMDASDPMLYGGSGHAFLMNLHDELCPSSPYCWNRAGFVRLLRNLGIEMVDHGFFHGGSGAAERAAVETLLRAQIDRGVPCSLLNMENQLITGYDETGFDTAQPWGPQMDFPPARLTYGSWVELANEVHVSFFSFPRADPADDGTIVAESLRYAVDLYLHPEAHTQPPYAVGARAWSSWITAAKNGHAGSHGNWWNAMVWSECRSRASEYLSEASEKQKRFRHLAALALGYREIAELLAKVSDRNLDAERKIALLERAAAVEADCIRDIEGSAALRI